MRDGALILGHRGAPADEPENTLAAFDRALAQGAHGIELDVRRTLDGVLVVHHDADRDGRLLSATTYRELCTPLTERMRPPRLEEAVALVAGRGVLAVELKEAGYEGEVLESVARVPRGALVLTSFLQATVARLKALDPTVCTCWNTGGGDEGEPFSFAAFRQARADLLGPSLASADAGLLEEAGAEGVRAAVWTVNDTPSLRRLLADERVAAVITDVPAHAAALHAAP